MAQPRGSRQFIKGGDRGNRAVFRIKGQSQGKEFSSETSVQARQTQKCFIAGRSLCALRRLGGGKTLRLQDVRKMLQLSRRGTLRPHKRWVRREREEKLRRYHEGGTDRI